MTNLAIIGGSGFGALAHLEQETQQLVDTPYGKPSGSIVLGYLGEQLVVFISRHGQNHHLPPHQINYRANIWALQQIGVEKIVAVNSVGGIHPSMGPTHICIPDQLIDYTWGREHTFVPNDSNRIKSVGMLESSNRLGSVTHIDFTDPFSNRLRTILIEHLKTMNFPFSPSGVYGCTQGPRLETAAEIKRLQRDGCDLVGMTAMPEAALAKELGIDYACVCLVVNWAAGVTTEKITMAEIQAAITIGFERVNTLFRKSLTDLAINN